MASEVSGEAARRGGWMVTCRASLLGIYVGASPLNSPQIRPSAPQNRPSGS